MKPSLRQWQEALANALESPDAAPRLLGMVATGRRVPPASGLEVYTRTSQGARMRALRAAYPVCRQVVGEHCFSAFARDLVTEFPSTSPDLNMFGGELPTLFSRRVAQHPAFRELPWLPDLGHLEWTLHRALYSPDDPPPDFALLETHPDPGSLVPHLSHALSLVYSDYAVNEIWTDHQPGHTPLPLPDLSQQCHLVVYRSRGEPTFIEVETETFALLRACQDGQSLAGITGVHASSDEKMAMLVRAGWVTGFGEPPNHVRH